jgi:hypothetical protein
MPRASTASPACRPAPTPCAPRSTVSYVRSNGHADLNSFDQYFDNARDPIVRLNQYGPVGTDAPNRVVIRGSYRVRATIIRCGLITR